MNKQKPNTQVEEVIKRLERDFVHGLPQSREKRFDFDNAQLVIDWLRTALTKLIQNRDKCTRCNNRFEDVQWKISHGDEHYHTGCLENTPTKMTQLVEHTRAQEREEMLSEMKEIATTNAQHYSGEKGLINEHVLLFLEDFSHLSTKDKE